LAKNGYLLAMPIRGPHVQTISVTAKR